jgi:dTDP-4-amino-4,6-dideoxygalactose transaminase
LFGGAPLFAEPQHVGRPNIPDTRPFFERMRGVFERGWLSNDGPLVRELERRLAEVSGAKHAVAVANATLGLEIAARALGFEQEVIVPALTFVATAHAMLWQGMEPVLADVDLATHMLSVDCARQAITPRTTGLIPVHLWGLACDVDGLVGLGRERGLKVLFDGSHSLFATYHGRPIGRFGDATVFSFHATKFINSFEGGAIVTNDDEVADRCRRLRNFGFTGYDQVDDLGINAKMHEASAAMGLTSLDAAERIIETNRRNLELYQSRLSDLPGFSFMPRPRDERDNFQYVVTMIDQDRSPLDRDLLIKLLWAENLRVRRYFYPGVHRMAPYRDNPLRHPVPVTERICERVLQFPTGLSIGPGEIESTAGLLRFLWDNAEAIRARVG